jgi:hypothetical protein
MSFLLITKRTVTFVRTCLPADQLATAFGFGVSIYFHQPSLVATFHFQQLQNNNSGGSQPRNVIVNFRGRCDGLLSSFCRM